MTGALLGVAAFAVLFVLFALVRRERGCDGACPGCGSDCTQWLGAGRHLREVGRDET